MNDNTYENLEPQDNLVRLPLWRSALDQLIKDGVSYGQTISAEWFEKQLRCNRDTMQFGISVASIRRELERSGYYLSGRGQKGNQFVILPPSSNADVIENYGHAAADMLKRGVILGAGTKLDTLTEEERRRHEGISERMAIKSALLQRARAVQKVIEKHAPKVLKAVAVAILLIFAICQACRGSDTSTNHPPIRLQSAAMNTNSVQRPAPLPTFEDGVRLGAVIVLRNPDVRDLSTVTRLAIAMWQQEQAGKK